jgi:hypothetical protein
MDVAAVMPPSSWMSLLLCTVFSILRLICIAYLTQILIVLDSVVDPADPVTNWPPESGSVILNYVSEDPDLDP